MKAIEISDYRKAVLNERPRPVMKAGHVLLKIAYVGFCGSDLSTFRGLNPLVRLPVVPGHEVGATIVELGMDVPTSLRVGMHATVNPYTNCGQCTSCVARRPNACEYNETLGVQRDGAMSEYILLPWEKVITDEAVSVRDFALVEPMSVGFHAVDRAQVTDIDTVLIFGCGMIGIGAIIRAVLRGATVIAVDVSEKKLALARRLGAQYTINSAEENLSERMHTITNGRGAEVVIEAVGRPETYQASVSEVAFAGRIVYIGYAKDAIPFHTQYFVKKELNILGSRNALPTDFKAVIEYLKRNTCPVDELITAIRKPDEVQQVLDDWDQNPGDVFRVLMEF